MAFFGLSALGPQNVFVASRAEIYNCSLFDMEEFVAAFDKIDRQKCGSLALSEVIHALELVFHGPLPELERERVQSAFHTLGSDESISRGAYISTVAELRELEEEMTRHLDKSQQAHYRSFDEMRAAKLRYRWADHGPAEMYSKPLTLLQEVGWQVATAVQKGQGQSIMDPGERHPKKQCAETKFMGEMVKSGYL